MITEKGSKRWERVALVIFAAMTALRLGLSAHLGLGDDEAYYWDWSRQLSLSYFDHPGMVAWLIALGTTLFGDTPFGVRFFGLAANAISGIFIWLLARELFDRKIAALSLLLYVFAPIFTVGGLLMVPDAPMAAAWTAFTWILWKLWNDRRASIHMWALAGVILGVGLLSKYTMILLAVSALVLFGFDRERRRDLLSKRFFATVGITFVLCLPILLWNVEHDWPSVKFHLHDRQTGGGGANFSRWGQFLASQLVILGPALFVVCMVALVASFRRLRERRWKFIASISTPPLAIFALQALFAEFKPHWPAPAYPLLFMGAAVLWMSWRKWLRVAVASLVLVFIVLINVVFYVGSVHPIAPALVKTFAPSAFWDPKSDPTNDLYGWPELALRVESIRAERAKQGEPPLFLSSGRYQLVAQYAFATGEEVWRIAPTRDHYTFTQTKERREALVGQKTIYLSDNRFDRDPSSDQWVLEDCEKLAPLEIFRVGVQARTFHLYVCKFSRNLY